MSKDKNQNFGSHAKQHSGFQDLYFKNIRTNKKGEPVSTGLCGQTVPPGAVVCISIATQENEYRKAQLDNMLKLQDETDEMNWFEKVSKPKEDSAEGES